MIPFKIGDIVIINYICSLRCIECPLKDPCIVSATDTSYLANHTGVTSLVNSCVRCCLPSYSIIKIDSEVAKELFT